MRGSVQGGAHTPGEGIMEPLGPADGQDLHQLRIDVLRRAIEVYLGIAYPSGLLPEVVRRRLEWPEGTDASSLMTRPPFERADRAGGSHGTIFALRLGNTRYPHMKLQIQPWPNGAGFLLSVNTHDQVLAIDPSSADALACRELQAENQRLKEAIEQAWDQAGLPTFLRYLRDYIESRSDAASMPVAADPGVGDGPAP
jgi:hypothetical protein